jgi:hypothetical protein
LLNVEISVDACSGAAFSKFLHQAHCDESADGSVAGEAAVVGRALPGRVAVGSQDDPAFDPLFNPTTGGW